jgi:peptidoglycan L-alanyl-D-glutamate endopeptidase CwlK
MTYKLSQKSLDRLSGVHPDLMAVVKRAIEITEVDFAVLEGVRSKARQEQLFKQKATKTMNSRHLTGHAVDLGAYVAGSIRWDWGLYYKLAEAVQQAAKELNVQIVWGGVWDRALNQIGDPADEVAAYVQRRRDLGKKAFIDGPHFELSRKEYPA